MRSRLTMAVLSLSSAVLVAPAHGDSDTGRKGALHLTKDCSAYLGQAGNFCTFTVSNLGEVPPGAKVYYLLPAKIVPNLVDTDVVLDAGGGNRALGHCTLDFVSFHGLCTFSDGMGTLAGFEARVDVTPATGPALWNWDGFYRFRQKHDLAG